MNYVPVAIPLPCLLCSSVFKMITKHVTNTNNCYFTQCTCSADILFILNIFFHICIRLHSIFISGHSLNTFWLCTFPSNSKVHQLFQYYMKQANMYIL